jgi:hypothetical protein
MTRHGVLAALYVPFNILVIENDGGSVSEVRKFMPHPWRLSRLLI